VVEADQVGGWEPVQIQQRGDQPVSLVDPATVRAGHGQVRLDDPHI